MLTRMRDTRRAWNLSVTEPVAGNYYPINSAVGIADGAAQLTLLVDRAVGAASISDGELEVRARRHALYACMLCGVSCALRAACCGLSRLFEKRRASA